MAKSLVFFWLLLAFITGVAAASFLPLGVPAVAAFLISGGSMAAFGLLRAGERQKLLVAGFAAVVFAVGMFWFFRSEHADRFTEDVLVGERVVLEGVVADDPVRWPRSQELLLREDGNGREVRVILRPFPEYRYGERLRVSGRLERSEREARLELAFPEVASLGPGEWSIYRLLFAVRERFSDALLRHLPEPEGSFAAGLLLGERQNFPEALREDLRITGTTHLVALSGYNITIVADTLARFFSLLRLPLSATWWLALAGIAAFTLATGAAASVVRAAIMGALILLARRSGRIYHLRNALALAAAGMLVHDPSLLRFDIGFQLSFLATLGLVYLSPVVASWLSCATTRMFIAGRGLGFFQNGRIVDAAPRPSFLRDTLTATLAAQLAVLPLIVFHFGQLSLVAPAANLAVLPFVPLTMFLGFVTGAAGFLGDELGRAAALAGRLPLAYALSAIRWFASLPAASIDVLRFGPAMLVGAYAVLGILVWRSSARPRTV